MRSIANRFSAFARTLAVTAAGFLMLSAVANEPAEAALVSPAGAPSARQVSDALTTEVRFGGGHGGGFHGGGFRGGGFHGGGFRGGGFHGGGFRGGHFHGGSFRAFHGGYRYGGARFVHRRHFYRPYYGYYAPYYHRRCRIIWTYHGPRRVCWRRHWHHWRYW